MNFVCGALGRPSRALGKDFPVCLLSGHPCPVSKPNHHICSKSELWWTPALVCYWDLMREGLFVCLPGKEILFYFFMCVVDYSL